MGAEQLLSAAGHGEAAIQEAVDAIVRAAQSSVPKPSGVTASASVEIPEPSEAEPEEAAEEDSEPPSAPSSPSAAAEAADDESQDDNPPSSP
jgi:hypothetical protein